MDNYPGFVPNGCPACNTDPSHICNQLGIATQSLDELEFDRGLWGACTSGDLSKVKELLDKGKNPNAPDQFGYAPLHYTARRGDTDIALLLLSKGANPNAQTYSGQVREIFKNSSLSSLL
eukprot:TRINITY_DN2161_c0_g1_i1.p1 TRINITY_DN2161_c0_g1~~TRINITY_DN2161_c0_g1_i1.p1  ORF type:complete len:129 (-),score=28.29 TRINITY_DN2161_c0_g1_i1:349-708(-)